MIIEYPKRIRFHCLRCGLCCGDTKARVRHILLLATEARRISEETSLPIREFATKTASRGPYAYEMKKTAQEGKCLFLENNNCRIYSLRPLICRFYPFELKSSENGQVRFSYTKDCPGTREGNQPTRKFFEGLLKDAQGEFGQSLYSKK